MSSQAQAQLPLEGAQTKAELMYPAATISQLLMITDRRLRQLAQEGVVPKQTHGRYPLVGCVQGYVKYLQQLRTGGDERSQEATRLSRVRADLHELEFRLKNEDLYQRDVVDEALFQVCTNFAAMLDGSASRIASQLGGGAALRTRLIDEFREIRSQIAVGLREFSGRLREDGWNNRATTKPVTRKVGKRKPRPAKRKRRARPV